MAQVRSEAAILNGQPYVWSWGAGLETRPLAVSRAFHSPLMEPMLAAFREVARGVAYHAPTVRVLSMRPRLKPPNDGYEYPAWVNNAMGGIPAAINPGMFFGAKTIAATLVDLLTEPMHLKRAHDEFKERTGGGVGGTKWVAPLLPRDFDPPVDLRWPEYVETVRGPEWWIPTPHQGSGAGEPL